MDKVNDKCKFCGRSFARTLNPTVQNPAPDDLLKRRTAGSRECRPCHNFQKSERDPTFTGPELVKRMAADPSIKAGYLERLENWEASRRRGKRSARAGPETKIQAEQTTSLETRQILGYLWPKSLLKRHGISFAGKKLQSVEHAGRIVKGLTRAEWTFGAIEVIQTAAKTAKRLREQAADSSDSGGETLFNAMEQQVRAKAPDNTKGDDEDLQLKLPAKSSTLEDDFAMILWGGAGGGSSSASTREPEDDDTSDKVRPAPKKRALGSGNFNFNAFQVPSSSAASQAGLETASNSGHPEAQPWLGAGGGGGGGGGGGSAPNNKAPKNKKQATESRELDKTEALILQANQLLANLQSPESFMSVQLQKANTLLEKLRGRLSEDCSGGPTLESLGHF